MTYDAFLNLTDRYSNPKLTPAILSMNPDTLGKAWGAQKCVMHRVAENLYRQEPSGGYYALRKRGDKQFRRSLRTKDRKLAERRLAELRAQVGNVTISEDARLTFAEIAQRWLSTTAHALKESTVTRRTTCIKNLTPSFAGMSIPAIQKHCERWATQRAAKAAPQTMAHELNVLSNVFDYGADPGLMLSNPARGIRRLKILQTPITVPTRDQFKRLIAAIRESDGRRDSQAKAKPGADLVELLAYSSCRIHEAVTLTGATWIGKRIHCESLAVKEAPRTISRVPSQ